MTRTLAAQRLESIIAGAMSFIFEMIDLSNIEIFLFDEENSAKSMLMILLSCLFWEKSGAIEGHYIFPGGPPWEAHACKIQP